MMPTMSSSRKFIPGRSCARSYSFSSAKPDSRANSADNAPSPAVTASPSSVPARAVDVRIETPWATYSTTNMIAVPPTSATTMPGLPVMRAGSMKPTSTTPANPSPSSANNPFQRATASTTMTNSTASTPSTGSRLTDE